MLFNGVVGVLLAIPIVRYLFSPVSRGRKSGYESWISLGSVDQFPSGQTRLATYRNPVANASDGETADIPCWVRNVDGNRFQVFAINCAHLGCPVRWFPQSRTVHVPVPWRSLLRGRLARFRSAGARLVRIRFQGSRWKSADSGGRDAHTRLFRRETKLSSRSRGSRHAPDPHDRRLARRTASAGRADRRDDAAPDSPPRPQAGLMFSAAPR